MKSKQPLLHEAQALVMPAIFLTKTYTWQHEGPVLRESERALSNSTVRSAWKVRHCRQQRKMTSAASGRPLWKPRFSAQQPDWCTLLAAQH